MEQIEGSGAGCPASAQATQWEDSSVCTDSPTPRSLILRARRSTRRLFFFAGTKWSDSAPAALIRKSLQGRAFTVMALLAVLLALFLPDIFALFQVATNVELDVVLTCVVMLFLAEMFGLLLTDPAYPLGFFFWMDLVGALSMLFDISYLLGVDATKVKSVGADDASEGFVLVRAARVTKLGARAGRLSRVLKILRFMPWVYGPSQDDGAKVKMAKVISGQLTNMLATRVAFLSIALVIVLPLFGIFAYPEVDDSMAAWTELLARNAEQYHQATLLGNASLVQVCGVRLQREAQACADFYSALTYGPFRVCYGEKGEDGIFSCRPDVLDLRLASDFSRPCRNSSIQEVHKSRIQTSFDLAAPRQHEAAAAIGLIVFMILIMCVFGLLMSNSISVVALQPLERMLNVVRQRCKQIFKYTNELKEDDNPDSEDEVDEVEQASEFTLLEKVVAKLAAIAHLSSGSAEPEIKENMNENEIIALGWLQGAQQFRTSPRGFLVEASGHEPEQGLQDAGEKRAIPNIPTDILEMLGSDDFNALDMSKEIKTSMAAHIIFESAGSRAWVRSNVMEAQLVKFVTAVEAKYQPNSFHNFSHGLDVQHSVYQFLQMIGAEAFVPETSQFWLLVAAIAHDVGHIGVNNQYLVEMSHELALKYNDCSPMENMHCALLFKLASEPEADIFSQMEKELYKEMRKGMITAILHTDFTKHNDMNKEAGLLYQMNSEAFDGYDPGSAVAGHNGHLQMVLNLLLHCADIANPMKPWTLCQRYAYLCLDEFFAQGDLEKAAGIPVQMLNDREKVNKPNSQVGFIEFVITPMAEAIVNLFPQLDDMAMHLGQNIENWSEVWQEQCSPSAENVAKVAARVQKVAGRCKALMRAERHLP
mmetsp:Transcript_8075/g.23669  ORF Transcript_8075/g.23669 Transcript_8075/m.23669 type:complete len:876 (-) Transcript_8075:115-2742(-)